MSLRTELVAAGLNVRTVAGWSTRGGTWKVGKPMGVMQHHTALPVPFPVDRLYGDRLKCNINTKPDGTVWLIAAKACNFSSGMGSNVVLTEVLSANPPTQNARDRGLTDDTNGNPYFFNFENDHAGDGGPMPAVQHDAIVRATRVVLDHYDLDPGNVISHAEWTARKNDPNWNGSNRATTEIRRLLEEDPAMKPPTWAREATQWHIDRGIYSGNVDDLDEELEFHRQTVFRHRFYNAIRSEFGAGMHTHDGRYIRDVSVHR